MADVPQTLPVDDRGGPIRVGRTAIWLVIAWRSDRPFDPPSRHRIDDVDTVVVERGATHEVVRHSEGGTRCLTVRLPDGSISAKHFSIGRAGEHRMLRDSGSRNGTLLNGVARTVFPLKNGDLIEAGRTLLLYREAAADEHEAVEVSPSVTSNGLATIAPGLAARLAFLPRLASSNIAVLLQAETGTGKELVSQALHHLSGRRGPFIAVNCGAIPATMIEAELFGHRRGAFSGATEDRVGLVRAADGGTLLLDEIGDLPLACQAAFLRVLQSKLVRPVGETREIAVDVRVVAATHRDLTAMVAAGSFRADLLARIAGYTMDIPPLRERKEDIGLLAGLVVRRTGNPSVTFTSAAASALFRYDWPLNVRELEKCVEAALVLAAGRPVDVVHLADPVRRAATVETRGEALDGLDEREQRHRAELVGLLREHGGNISAVARATGKARMQIQRWVKRYRITER
jgi:sigma-54 dependent transcriptional regulator, acetoin dehydrogenase operon transcriptional activator AcoR